MRKKNTMGLQRRQPWWRSIHQDKPKQASNSKNNKVSSIEEYRATSVAKASAKGEANATMVAKHPPENRPTMAKHLPRMVSANYPP
jgi:hypothetical protein